MSHSDMAIEEMELLKLNEKFFKEMRESDSFKFGYCRSAINTALWFYDLGKTEQAITCLRDCAELMRDGREEVSRG